MNFWIQSLLFVAVVIPITSSNDVGYTSYYYVATESNFENGGYYDSNERYYVLSNPYFTTFGERVTRGGNVLPNGTYVPTEYEYTFGGYYTNGYTIFVPSGSYNATGYFTPTDSYYRENQNWYYDSNGVYYPRDSEPYFTTFGERVTNGGNVLPNGTYVPTEYEYTNGGYYPEYSSYDRYVPHGSYNATGYWSPHEAYFQTYGDYYDPNGRYYPSLYMNEYDSYPDGPTPYPTAEYVVAYPEPFPKVSEPYPHPDEPKSDHCDKDSWYVNTFGAYVFCGGTFLNGFYVPTESEYYHGGYKNSRGYYVPRGYYTKDDVYEDGSDYGGSDYGGSYQPYDPYEFDDSYEYSMPEDGNENHVSHDVSYEDGECGRYNTMDSKFHQSAQKCLNNAERFEDQATEYIDRLETEVNENPNCKYIQAVMDGDDTNVAQEFKDLFDQLSNLDEPVDFLEWLQNVPEKSYLNVCAEIAELQSCLVDGLLPILSEAIDIVEKDQCCTELMDRISIEEYSIVERIEMIVNQVPNLFCLNRIPDVSVTSEQNCGYTIVQSMFPPVFDEIAANLKALVQIPNDEACNAFNGQIYTDTNGKKNFLTINLPIGSCSSAFDTIFSTAKAFLIDDGDNSLYDFAIDSGLIPRSALDDLEKEIGPLKALFDDGSCSKLELPEGLGEICLNFPTEFTRECYPALAAKSVYGGPMEGLFGTPKSGGSEDGNNYDTGIAGSDESEGNGTPKPGESEGNGTPKPGESEDGNNYDTGIAGSDESEGNGTPKPGESEGNGTPKSGGSEDGNNYDTGIAGSDESEGNGTPKPGESEGNGTPKPGENTGIAGQSTSIAVTLVALVSMLFINTSWMYLA